MKRDLLLPNAASTHVYPLEDLRDHVISPWCWCKPTQDLEELRLFVHHAMDGREAFEEGERLLS